MHIYLSGNCLKGYESYFVMNKDTCLANSFDFITAACLASINQLSITLMLALACIPKLPIRICPVINLANVVRWNANKNIQAEIDKYISTHHVVICLRILLVPDQVSSGIPARGLRCGLAKQLSVIVSTHRVLWKLLRPSCVLTPVTLQLGEICPSLDRSQT